jgi:hypothetical protein
MIHPAHMHRHGVYGMLLSSLTSLSSTDMNPQPLPIGPGPPPPMPYTSGIFELGGGMPMQMPMYPGAELMGMGMMGHPGLHSMGKGMSGFHPAMLGGGMRSRHSPCYHQTHSYGCGRNGARYFDPYDLFDDVFEDDMYVDGYDDIDDPLLMWMRMARGGSGGRRGRRGRYGRYGGGGLGYHGLL